MRCNLLDAATREARTHIFYTATQNNMNDLDAFLGSDSAPRPDLFISDGQHDNEEGHEVRAALTQPFLEKWHAPAK